MLIVIYENVFQAILKIVKLLFVLRVYLIDIRVFLLKSLVFFLFQMYYMSIHHSSPAYSIAFDPSNLYVALDQSVHVMNFAGFNNKMINYNFK